MILVSDKRMAKAFHVVMFKIVPLFFSACHLFLPPNLFLQPVLFAASNACCLHQFVVWRLFFMAEIVLLHVFKGGV